MRVWLPREKSYMHKIISILWLFIREHKFLDGEFTGLEDRVLNVPWTSRKVHEIKCKTKRQGGNREKSEKNDIL